MNGLCFTFNKVRIANIIEDKGKAKAKYDLRGGIDLLNTTQKVPYGYEPPKDQPRGTLIYYDSFEHTQDEDLDIAAHTATDRSFARFVLYPLHEETVKRMSKSEVSPYF